MVTEYGILGCCRRCVGCFRTFADASSAEAGNSRSWSGSRWSLKPDCLVRECAQCASHARASQQRVAESDVGNISKPASRFERGIYQNNRTDDKVQKVVIRTCEILAVEVNVVFSASSGESLR